MQNTDGIHTQSEINTWEHIDAFSIHPKSIHSVVHEKDTQIILCEVVGKGSL